MSFSQKFFFVCTIYLAALYAVQCAIWDPQPKPDDQGWMDKHNRYVENSRVNGSNINIVFTGSSVCENWGNEGKKVWDAIYAPLGAVNYGIGGDQIQHCLWRAMNGELENIKPKVLMMYCGSNNVPSADSEADIVRAVTVTLEELHRRLPETKILYIAIQPRNDVGPVDTVWNKITNINTQILTLNNGDDRTVFSMFDNFTRTWGQIREELYNGDKLHLNPDGYQHWHDVWQETFFRLLNA